MPARPDLDEKPGRATAYDTLSQRYTVVLEGTAEEFCVRATSLQAAEDESHEEDCAVCEE